MPIISSSVIDKKNYRVTLTVGHGITENVVITDDGIYEVHYIRDHCMHNHCGRIISVVQNRNIPQNSYILFDWSQDNSNRKERIYFYQVQYIKDITPNDGYHLAIKHGFVGTETDWLESLHGDPGKDAYELALEVGFEGTLEEWLANLKGEKGDQGDPGKSAYEIAVDLGFEGTIEEWNNKTDNTDLYKRVEAIQNKLTWIRGM